MQWLQDRRVFLDLDNKTGDIMPGTETVGWVTFTERQNREALPKLWYSFVPELNTLTGERPTVVSATWKYGDGQTRSTDDLVQMEHYYVAPGEYEVHEVLITGVRTFRDEAKGSDRGLNTAFVVELDGLHAVHLGDVGHALTEEMLGEIGQWLAFADAITGTSSVARLHDGLFYDFDVDAARAGHVGLADARRIANVGTAAHLHDHHIAVGFADDPFAVGIARHAEQRIHLALTQQPGIPGVHPERPILRRRGRTGRAQNQQQRGENRRPETTGLRRFHTKTGHSVWDK